MNFDTIVLDVCEVKIGEDTLFGPGCRIITATHPLDYKSRKFGGRELGKPVTVSYCLKFFINFYYYILK